LAGTSNCLKALPIVKIEVVDIRHIRASRMMLDLKVIVTAYLMPSSVAVKGPMVKALSPSNENGRKNQRNKIKPFANPTLTRTRLSLRLDNSNSSIDRKIPGTNADRREHTAIRIEKAATAMILTLGSRAWIIDLPYVRSLSNIFTTEKANYYRLNQKK
jgi:hypothetical protein